eukprot:6185980-Pleurochrysis_carterae.AAC.1
MGSRAGGAVSPAPRGRSACTIDQIELTRANEGGRAETGRVQPANRLHGRACARARVSCVFCGGSGKERRDNQAAN